eukprot:8203839-Prorocentrum_lima.AAC.1
MRLKTQGQQQQLEPWSPKEGRVKESETGEGEREESKPNSRQREKSRPDSRQQHHPEKQHLHKEEESEEEDKA